MVLEREMMPALKWSELPEQIRADCIALARHYEDQNGHPPTHIRMPGAQFDELLPWPIPESEQ